MLVTTSFSFAQSSERKDARLLAKAEIRISTAPSVINDSETFKWNSENPPNNDARINYRSNSNTDQLNPTSPEPGEVSSEIPLLVKNELKLDKYHDLTYKSPSLEAEDLHLVMSSADKKTMSVVLPPFLYFKKQF